eukprot:COSAG02_NODE_11570_length_1697_cov_99.140175_1_plen_76_part_00
MAAWGPNDASTLDAMHTVEWHDAILAASDCALAEVKATLLAEYQLWQALYGFAQANLPRQRAVLAHDDWNGHAVF